MKHTCPHPGCTRTVGSRQFGCKPHWFELPRDLRNRIWAAARAVCAVFPAVPSEKMDRLRAVHAEAEKYWTEHAEV